MSPEASKCNCIPVFFLKNFQHETLILYIETYIPKYKVGQAGREPTKKTK